MSIADPNPSGITPAAPAPVAPAPVADPTAVEPGYLTTEFWMAVVVQVISVLVLFHVIRISSDQVQAITGILGLIVPQALYALSRGLRKAGTAG